MTAYRRFREDITHAEFRSAVARMTPRPCDRCDAVLEWADQEKFVLECARGHWLDLTPESHYESPVDDDDEDEDDDEEETRPFEITVTFTIEAVDDQDAVERACSLVSNIESPEIDVLDLNAYERRRSACNVCDGAIETPNPFGYCNAHLAEMAVANQETEN